MPQALLPLIAEGATPLNELISVVREDGQWVEWHLRCPNSFRALAFGNFHGVRGGACMVLVCV
jgi:hypothetical protein